MQKKLKLIKKIVIVAKVEKLIDCWQWQKFGKTIFARFIQLTNITPNSNLATPHLPINPFDNNLAKNSDWRFNVTNFYIFLQFVNSDSRGCRSLQTSEKYNEIYKTCSKFWTWLSCLIFINLLFQAGLLVQVFLWKVC